MKLNKVIATLGAAALLVPAAAVAKGKPEDAGSKGKAKGKSKPATFIFKGTYNADGTVAVTGGNSRGKKFKGSNVTFDWSKAKFNVADTNGDGASNAGDFKPGDKLVVQAKLPRNSTGTGPFAARKAVDQTNPKPEETPTPAATPAS